MAYLITGTSSAAISYARRAKIDWRTTGPAAAGATCFSGLGALTASSIPAYSFRPATMVPLLLVLAFVVLRPSFGTVTEEREVTTRHRIAAMLLAGVAVGNVAGPARLGTRTARRRLRRAVPVVTVVGMVVRLGFQYF